MIVAVKAERDAQGYWMHPALMRSCCHTMAELMHWLRVQKLECFVMTMRDEETDAFSAGWHGGPPDASMWALVPPPGEGWFLGSVHPRENGPECYWFRQTTTG
ncbi:hypothetical protein GW952_30770 (plasmid) [Klebsiella michiganensis]|uniref:Uncharacterized protein n=1 Tax=Klebsiella michiganensis TaxID=1134687 RepID=A0A6P1V674_9ENTR|nr:hypothetical protein [Klebsiella michiganensis]QHS50004.1 hypothetical protein GW952_30770 [Klebsiella michiganensis]HDX8941048.1 hypothetical protein [Klebsiella michiganensis]